ncbi:MAG TPA: TonB-dependent receptor [Pyrinomonadaceae bacterium]|jgi:iron complex outermembrane receptor protein
MRRETSIQKFLFALTFALLLCPGTTRVRAQGASVARPAAASAQTSDTATISGRVLDPQGAGVAGATLTLYARDARPASRISTTTDRTGAYRFELLAAPAEYIIETEGVGFERTGARVLRVERGASVVLDIPLALAGLRADVVVTASDSPQPVDEVSKAVTVVGRAEIEERDELSITEALRTVPGLRVQRSGGPGSLTTVKMRGLRNQDTAVLVDGLRFRDVTTLYGDASSFLSDLLVTDVSRVEVLRGSGSSLYGTNAIGGVVHIVTDEGGSPFRGSLLAEGGSLGLFRGRAQLAGGAGEADRLVYSAGVTHLNVSRGVDGDDATRNTNAQGRLLFRLTPTATLSARLYAGDAFLQLNDTPQATGALPARGIVEAVPLALKELRRFESGTPLAQLDAGAATFVPAANDPDSSRATRFFTGALTFAQRPAEAFGYSVAYQGLTTRSSFREGPAGTSFFEPAGSESDTNEGRVHTLNARADLRLGRHNFLTAGYEFESEDFNNRLRSFDPANNSSVEVAQRSHTFFIQDQLRFLEDRLQLSAAFRTQRFSLSSPRFEPAAGAPYAGLSFEAPPVAYTGDGSIAYLFRSTGTKLRAHVGNGYRAPSLYERFGRFYSVFGYSVFGDPRLRPERSIAFDAGIDQTLAQNRVRLSATYFYTRLQEIIDFGLTPDDPFGRFFGYFNTGGGLARGAELSAELAPTRTLNLFVSYTYTNSDQRRPILQDVLQTFGVSDHQFTLVATQRIGRRFLLNFDLFAASDYLVGSIFDNQTFGNPVYRFDGPVKADLAASYTLPLARSRSIRFFGKLENLFDRANYENGFRTPGRTALAGAAYSF